MELKVDFERGKTSRLILQLSYPSIIGMLANASYNVVAGIYLGNFIGTDALGATNAVLPIQIFFMAIATMLGVGVASLVSRRLGEQRNEEAANFAGTAFVGALITGGLIFLLTYLFMEPLLLGAGSTLEILEGSKSYLLGILFGWLIYPMVVVGNNLLRCVGEAKKASFLMIFGIVVNAIITPVLILVFNLGIFGAGIGTTIAQLSCFFIMIYYYKKGYFFLPLERKHFKLKLGYFKDICEIGFSTFLRQSIGSLTFLIYNRFLLTYGGLEALNSIGIINKVLTMITLPIFGFLQGIQPLVGYNYGAKNFKRVKSSVYQGLSFCLLISFGIMAFIFIFIDPILGIFTQDPGVQAMSKTGMYFVFGLLPLVSFQLVGTTVYQAFGKVKMALFLAIVRQLLLSIPLVFILSQGFGIWGVWSSFPIADGISAILSGLAIFFGLRKIEKQWKKEGIL